MCGEYILFKRGAALHNLRNKFLLVPRINFLFDKFIVPRWPVFECRKLLKLRCGTLLRQCRCYFFVVLALPTWAVLFIGRSELRPLCHGLLSDCYRLVNVREL